MNQDTRSQVSFKIEGEHTKDLVVCILEQKLQDLKYQMEQLNEHTYRMYVYSSEGSEKAFDVCYSIQCNVVYDLSRVL